MIRLHALRLAAAAALAFTFLACAQAYPPAPVLNIDAGKITARVSPTLYGLMTEEINFSYEGGIYAELIRNRAFNDDAKNPAHWSVVKGADSAASISLDDSQPIPNTVLTHSVRLEAVGASAGHRVGLAKDGYWGIPVRPSTTYHLSFYAKAGGAVDGPLTVDIESTDGSRTFAKASVASVTPEWAKYTLTLTTADDVAPTAATRFVISTTTPGTFWFGLVSLFPPTFHDRPNGNRPDIMQLLADMKPAFLRLPGGNFLEGDTIADRFPWKKTIGPLEQRPGHRGCWHYGANDGMGLLEFMEWCEDLRIEPVLAVYAGYSLKGQHVNPGADLQPFVDDALDEIEYVTGDVTTKWGAERAKDGHPAPFPLHYVEIGNEDGFDKSGSYEGRFVQFYDAIKRKYPALHCISTVGGHDPLGRRFNITQRTPDLVDEHYYRNAFEMEDDAAHYDGYDRKGPKVFVGEWATREGRPTTNMNAALGDAAWMTGMERNSDVVVLASYAPLFVNVNPGGMQWASDLIGYDALHSYGSPSYYAQKMFSTYLGDSVVSVTGENIPTQVWHRPPPKAKPNQPAPVAPPPKAVPTLFFVATKSAAKGALYLKVVNASDAAETVTIHLSGMSRIAPEGTAITLGSAHRTDTNSITEPEKIVPIRTSIDGIANDFSHTFPACSITVLEISGSATPNE